MSRVQTSTLATLASVVAVLFIIRWFGSFLLAARSPIPIGDGTLGGAPHLLLCPAWFMLVGRRLGQVPDSSRVGMQDSFRT